MNRLSLRIWFGAALIVWGLLALVERLGVLPGITSVVWGLLLIAAGGFFLYRFHALQL